ncbi:alpha/beta fold hydrolase [uncultured Friedmanniella sp.]|uniref:alpha/beta fold hydrolase n=1 Tax=uncultured Friedmanniella sp. TaxID=335381 RepID=UPI0035C9E8F0
MTSTTTAATTHQLDVPGGRLYYEVRGTGPLLLVVGQPMTSGAFASFADLLAEDHTVVTYDPRGLGQSTVDDPSLAVTPEIQADDLALLVEALDRGPADIFGSSGGAVAGLALVARHPERVRTLVAHEPPVTELLADAPYVRPVVDGVEDAYRSGGSGAGWGAFVSLVMHQGPVTEAGVAPTTWPPRDDTAPDDTAPDDTAPDDTAPDDTAPDDTAPDHTAPDDTAPDQVPAAPAAPPAKQQADDELFFLRMLKPFTRYEPPADVLRSAGPEVVVAVGAASTSELAVRSAVALAERLGVTPVVFPGDHAGLMGDPAGFADTLRQVLPTAS